MAMMNLSGNQTEGEQFGGADVDLAQLAGMEMDGIKSQRRVKFNKGVYKWRILPETGFDIQDVTSSKTNQKYKRAVITMPLECLEVGDIFINPDQNEADMEEIRGNLVGKTHFERFPIEPSDKETSIGYYKAFLEDIGLMVSGSLEHCVDSSKSHEFYGIIGHKKNQQDPDNPWVNIIREKHKLRSAMVTEAA